ncbi:YezD family protein [Anaerocolumna sp. AGMB13025]|jgi:hypothetical protein|uniref:YezD family protein n=1 Tax=Anaerocolumna sp. AGMB13025 TaxID=3039116 RepID=UPI0024203C47|nr:YezD family protein [Anaerocolumna sp. AGMB13025]WFR54778.1 YezD family protein [Anaerocolumna sp. AGMB13025]
MAVESFKNQIMSLKNLKEFELILNYLAIPKFGSLTIVIHDGKVVQIEKTEKFRV